MDLVIFSGPSAESPERTLAAVEIFAGGAAVSRHIREVQGPLTHSFRSSSNGRSLMLLT